MALSSPIGRSSVRAEPNVTPMIDVMLVLLIIFMIIVPSITSGLQATPPSGKNLKPHPPEDADQILGIDVNGRYYLNRKPISNASLGPMLSDIYGRRTEDKVLYIKADKSLDYGRVLDVLDMAAHNGVRVSAMVTDQAPGTVSNIPDDRRTPGAVGLNGGTR